LDGGRCVNPETIDNLASAYHRQRDVELKPVNNLFSESEPCRVALSNVDQVKAVAIIHGSLKTIPELAWIFIG
jgi:hypothetical protein